MLSWRSFLDGMRTPFSLDDDDVRQTTTTSFLLLLSFPPSLLPSMQKPQIRVSFLPRPDPLVAVPPPRPRAERERSWQIIWAHDDPPSPFRHPFSFFVGLAFFCMFSSPLFLLSPHSSFHFYARSTHSGCRPEQQGMPRATASAPPHFL